VTAAEAKAPIRVLVVDDHPVVRQGLRSMLAAEDIEVVGEAGSGADAVALVEKLAPDITLMDIRMPDMDGLSAMAAMKRLPVKTSIIILTTYNSMQYLVRSVIYGAAGYFMKGISRDELLAAVRAVAQGQSLLQVNQLRTVIERLVREDAKAAPHAVKKLASARRSTSLLRASPTGRSRGCWVSATPRSRRTSRTSSASSGYPTARRLPFGPCGRASRGCSGSVLLVVSVGQGDRLARVEHLLDRPKLPLQLAGRLVGL
jgi:DNA-binding NarL/FixJ family response regulator